MYCRLLLRESQQRMKGACTRSGFCALASVSGPRSTPGRLHTVRVTRHNWDGLPMAPATPRSLPTLARFAVLNACDDFRRTHQLSRRALLRIGARWSHRPDAAECLCAEKATKPHKATAKSVIMLFQFGGPSQLDTFDPKPNAPSGIRGEFKTIPSKTPGLLVTEHLPRLAAMLRPLLGRAQRSAYPFGAQLRGVLLIDRPRTAHRHRHRQRLGHRLPASRLDRRLLAAAERGRYRHSSRCRR